MSVGLRNACIILNCFNNKEVRFCIKNKIRKQIININPTFMDHTIAIAKLSSCKSFIVILQNECYQHDKVSLRHYEHINDSA